MKKEGLIIVFAVLFMIPVLSAFSLQKGMNEINTYITDYKSDKISAPQLIVYMEYVKNKMYETLDKEGKRAFSEDEIKTIFSKLDTSDKKEGPYSVQYEKKFITDDFHVVFRADSFFRHDKEYYEQREEDTENYYIINYELAAVNTESFYDLSKQVKSFMSDLEDLIDSKEDANAEEELRKNFNKIKQKFWEMKNKDDCEKLMTDSGLKEYEDNYGKDKNFYYLIKQETEKNCWNEQKCENICEERKVCDECNLECYEEEVCETVCKEESGNETNNTSETQEQCEEVCEKEEVCSECQENCWEEQDCYDKCEDEEKCDEWTKAEVRVEGNCREDGSDIHINAWGEGFDYYQGLNDGGEWNCESEMQERVKLRKVLQKDVNNEFAKWYFEKFLAGDDYDKILNGGNGFQNVLEILIRNEEEIANSLHCSETKTWPKGFEKIEINYEDANTHVEVWEKNIPVEWANTKYYTTLYKYSWIPSKELLKGLINYKISETDTFGPSAKDVAEIRADRGQMEIVNSLSERYGGSFDVKLKLSEEGEEIVLKYFRVNPDIIVGIVDSIDEKPDISIEVDYDVLYDFINYMSYEMEGDEIKGPHWVRIEGEKGPGKFFSVIGAVSKMWKQGVTLKPRYALLKLLFNSKDVIGLLKGPEQDTEKYNKEETVKLSGEMIRQ